MDLNLSGKNAVVCGASQGLGLASAKELALLGANIILVSRSDDKLHAAIKELDVSRGQRHYFMVADLSQPGELPHLAQKILAQSQIIHILVNNAGGPPAGPMVDTPGDEIEKAFRTHLIAAHLLVQLLLPGMRQAGYGRIINIVSTSVKQPINGLGISNLVRAAVANWAKTLANEIGFGGITVNNVLPGFTNTDRLNALFTKQAEQTGLSKEAVEQNATNQIPAKRIGEPEEFGAVVAFLCSPAASYVNGINLPVDGGRTGTL